MLLSLFSLSKIINGENRKKTIKSNTVVGISNGKTDHKKIVAHIDVTDIKVFT